MDEAEMTGIVDDLVNDGLLLLQNETDPIFVMDEEDELEKRQRQITKRTKALKKLDKRIAETKARLDFVRTQVPTIRRNMMLI